MVRLAAVAPAERKMLVELECPSYDSTPWVEGSPLSARRVALISSAALIRAGERPFLGEDVRFRAIPDATPDAEILTSHVSVNFDRTGMQQDLNCALPRARLRELAAEGAIGSVAERHYSFSGAVPAEAIEKPARRLTPKLRDDGVDAILLLPV